MREEKTYRTRRADGGFSLIEVLTVVTIMLIIGGFALPQLASSRRLLRSSAVPRELMSQLRLARQSAMSQREAITFQYDDVSKQITLYDHGAGSAGTAILTASNYPATTGSKVMGTFPLTSVGVPASEISYGRPTVTGFPTGALPDNANLVSLTSNKLNITFQPDGRVLNSAGVPTDFALFFYNPLMQKETAVAISVLGSAGRIKTWRYSGYANAFKE
ncbi:MAG: GspH/FimT family pseudopilin [Pyrinomonadaceae bacterium]